MHIGVLGGTGPEGKALAARLADVGFDVTIGSRSLERAVTTCKEIQERWPDRSLPLEGGDNQTAARAALVVVATPWDAAASTARSVAEHLDAKVVISLSNALARVGDEFQPLLSPRGSIAAHLQAAVPGAMVAAAFHHLPARTLGAIDVPMEGDVLVCSDHARATRQASEVVEAIPSLRALDAGSLSQAAAVEAFTSVLLELNIRYKSHSTVRFTGIKTS